jgi:hypothetical protein
MGQLMAQNPNIFGTFLLKNVFFLQSFSRSFVLFSDFFSFWALKLIYASEDIKIKENSFSTLILEDVLVFF